jgi:signal peptidase I
VNERPGQLISDFYAYNAGAAVHQLESTPNAKYLTPENSPAEYDPLNHQGPGAPPSSAELGQHWVDDLAVEVLAEVTGNSGELLLDLVRAGVHHECRINLADGKAKLTRIGADGTPLEFLSDDGKTAASATAQTSVQGPGSYRLRLSNCDHEVLLWVNGSVVAFDGPTTYDSEDLVSPAWSPADPGDMAPAGVGSRGAAVKLSQLRILRDKYYIAGVTGMQDEADYDQPIRIADDTQYGQSDADRIQRIFADPELWSRSNLFSKENRRDTRYKLQADQFLPMGDNSPQSYDGRFWGDNYTGQTHHYVERDLLIGKALLIYWPHTWNRPIPFTPNFTKMGRIR